MSGLPRSVALVCSVLLLMVFFFLFVKPRRAELGRVHEDVVQEQDRTQQLRTELARLEDLRDNAPRLQAALNRLMQLVPDSDQVPDFIFNVQNAAEQAGVGFVQITPELPKEPPEGAPLAEVRTTIGAKGGYFAVQDFVRRLYDLDRAVRIDNVTMTGTEDDQEAATNGRISVQLLARVFFDLPEGAATSSAATTGTAPETPAPSTTTP